MDGLITFCAKYFISLVALIGLLVWLQAGKKSKIQLAATTVLALVIAFILSKISAHFYYDPRPFVKNPTVAPLFAHPPDNGFPSDHSWISMTVAAVLFYYQKSWACVAAGLAVIIGIARVLAHVHSPIDIIGGFGIGIIAAVCAQLITKRILGQRSLNTSSGGQVPDSQN